MGNSEKFNILKYDADSIMHYISTGDSSELPSDVQRYIDLMELVRSMFDKYKSRRDIIKLLMTPTYDLSYYQANKIFIDSINFFYIDTSIKKEAWKNIVAEKALRLHDIELAKPKPDTSHAAKCLQLFAKYKGCDDTEKEELPEEMFTKPVVIYTIDPEDVGIPSVNRNDLAKFIDNLEVGESDKIKLKKDSLIINPEIAQEIDYEESTD